MQGGNGPAGTPRYCGGCGAQLAADAAFCHRCGKPLGQIAQGVPQTPGSRSEPPKTAAVFALGLLSVIVCAPLGIIGLIVSRKGNRAIKAGTASRTGLFTAGEVLSTIGTVFTGAFVALFLGIRVGQLVQNARLSPLLWFGLPTVLVLAICIPLIIRRVRRQARSAAWTEE